jgi:hypothetical protein
VKAFCDVTEVSKERKEVKVKTMGREIGETNPSNSYNSSSSFDIYIEDALH